MKKYFNPGKNIKIIMLSVFFFVILIASASCAHQYSKTTLATAGPLPRNNVNQDKNSIKEENIADVDLKTDDNINIKATFYKGKGDMPSIILLHMLGRSRSDWNELGIELQKLGYNAVAIDLRGHGQSDLNWRTFSENDFNKMILDAKSAKDFLAKNNPGSDFAVIGASIGANVALNFAAEDNSIKLLVLMSPGLDYRGVKTEESIKKFANPILIIASEGDSYAADSSRKLISSSKNSTLKIYSGSLHGTNLLGKTDVDKVIVEWIERNLT